MKKALYLIFALVSIGFCGEKYIGASQTDIEGGYSSEKLNWGIGLRALFYEVNRPSRFGAIGDVELFAFYIQKSIGQVKLQFGQGYHGNILYDARRSGFDAGSSIHLAKIGMEGILSKSVGVYWTCSPIMINNFDLTQIDSRDFNKVELGLLNPKIGIRLYF